MFAVSKHTAGGRANSKMIRVDHRQRTLDVDLGSEAMMYHLHILPGFPGSWNDEESSEPPHDCYHAALTGIWGQSDSISIM